MRDRQQGTTSHPMLIYMVLSIDHLTPATGKTVAVRLNKDGAASSAAALGAVTEIDSANMPGWYSLAGNATDRASLGSLGLLATATGCDPFPDEYSIVGYDPFDGATLGLSVMSTINTNITTLLASLGAFTGTGVNTVLGFLRAMSRSDLAAPSDMGGTYDPVTDSLQAISDKPSSGLTAAQVWDYLTTLIVTPGSIGAYILQQLGLISAGVGVIINAPLSPSTLELTLYNDTDYNTLSGVVLPTWTNADWIVYSLLTATSITLYWAITSSSEDTAAGTIVVDSATSFHLEIDHTEVFTLPLGVNVAAYKKIATLDVGHGSEEVMLVNAALTHLNYILYSEDSDMNTEPPP
jgi:hypothetical protein